MPSGAATRYRLQRIISTREDSFKADAPPNMLDDLEQYAEGTMAQMQALQVSQVMQRLCHRNFALQGLVLRLRVNSF